MEQKYSRSFERKCEYYQPETRKKSVVVILALIASFLIILGIGIGCIVGDITSEFGHSPSLWWGGWIFCGFSVLPLGLMCVYFVLNKKYPILRAKFYEKYGKKKINECLKAYKKRLEYSAVSYGGKSYSSRSSGSAGGFSSSSDSSASNSYYYKDGKGVVRSSTENYYYDAKGELRSKSENYYDSKGVLRSSGEGYYDGKGVYRSAGDEYYFDSNGDMQKRG